MNGNDLAFDATPFAAPLQRNDVAAVTVEVEQLREEVGDSQLAAHCTSPNFSRSAFTGQRAE